MSANELAHYITKFMVPRMRKSVYVSMPVGGCNIYTGNIPINLDAPFNMGENANKMCHSELDSTWMQLLARLSFSVSRRGNILTVTMIYYHETHYFSYTAECPSSIKLKILKCAVETNTYVCLRSLLLDVFENIMYEIIKPQIQNKIKAECVCLAGRPYSPEAHVLASKRKVSEVDK